MPQFHYKGVDRAGAEVSGSIDATSRQQVTKKLAAKGIRPKSIVDGSKPTQGKGSSSPKKSSGKKLFKKTNLAQPFLEKLLQLHKSGMPIGDAIRTLKMRLADPELQVIAEKLWSDLSEGLTLAQSMKRFPEVFADTIVYSIEAGEATGNLAPILENVIENLQNQAELKKKVLASLVYPIFITMVALGVVGLFLFYLLPRIQKMMQSLGGEMTLSAKLLIGTADIALYAVPIGVVGLIVGSVFIIQWRQTRAGRRATDSWILKIPYIHHIARGVVICQVSNLMASLIQSGINTTEAMGLTERLISNSVLRERFSHSQRQINDGMAPSKAFKQNRFYPDLALDILAVGENTGGLSHSFSEINHIYSDELADRLKWLTTFISSAALIFAFSLVTVLALSIVTSVLQFSNSLLS